MGEVESPQSHGPVFLLVGQVYCLQMPGFKESFEIFVVCSFTALLSVVSTDLKIEVVVG